MTGYHDERCEIETGAVGFDGLVCLCDKRTEARLVVVPALVEAVKGYHACAPAAGQALEECGYALIASDFHRANQAADVALSKWEQAQGEKP